VLQACKKGSVVDGNFLILEVTTKIQTDGVTYFFNICFEFCFVCSCAAANVDATTPIKLTFTDSSVRVLAKDRRIFGKAYITR